MKKESVNQFNQGMNLDLHPMVTPNSVLTDNLNGTFITYNGNEFCLQNDKGNFEVAHLSKDYVPIGAKEYNGIIYIVSVKNDFEKDENGDYIIDEETNEKIIDPSKCLTEIGTYPGIDWSIERDDVGEAKGKLNYNLYTPLGNFKALDQTTYGSFTNVKLGYTTQTPITIEIQPSYDGSVNLILTDGVNPVRMVNSGFSAIGNDIYKLIKRRGDDPINIYDEKRLDLLNLIRNCRVLSNVDLVEVVPGGQLKGGNYTLYIKFGDDDFNQTDVAAESSIISIFNGNDYTPYTISGTLLDERTDKKVHIVVTNADTQYSKIYVYYSREYSDTLGYRLTEYGVFKEPFSIKDQNNVDIWLTGFEQTETINREEINIDYHTVDYARAEAQQQNMLFLGNVGQKETYALYSQLRAKAANIVTTVKQSQLGSVSFLYNYNLNCTPNNAEYYSTNNIYNKLGYWPNEWYRFGIVFILNDGSLTPVFNMPGGYFEQSNSGWTFRQWNDEQNNPTGVFKTPNVQILDKTSIRPLYFSFEVPDLSELEVKGYFYVRQKRIPTTICQGLRIGVDKKSHLPITWNGKRWFTQSFLAARRWDSDRPIDVGSVKTYNDWFLPRLEYYNKSILPDKDNVTYHDLLENVAYQSNIIQNTSIQNWYETTYPTLESTLYNIYKSDSFVNSDTSEHADVGPVYTYEFTITHKYNLSNKQFEDYNSVFYYVTLEELPFPNVLTIANNTFCDLTEESALSGAIAEQSTRLVTNQDQGNDSNVRAQSEFLKKYIVYNNTDINNYNYGLLSLDPAVVANIRNMLDGSEFDLIEEYETTTKFGSKKSKWTKEYTDLLSNDLNESFLQVHEEIKNKISNNFSNTQCIFIPNNTKIKEVSGIDFSTIAGNPNDVSQYSYTSESFGVQAHEHHKVDGDENNWHCFKVHLDDNSYNTIDASKYGLRRKNNEKSCGDHGADGAFNDGTCQVKNWIETGRFPGFNSVLNINIIRGLFTPFVGINQTLNSHGIYSIRLKDISDDNAKLVRYQDESEFYTISKRFPVSIKSIDVYRGDCFTSTVSMRIIKNHIDPDVPVSDNIVAFRSWNDYVRSAGDYKTTIANDTVKNGYPAWNEVNRADVNTVDLGYWVTFKCLSSYNLGLRTIDDFDTQQVALMGNPKSFFPLNSGSTSTGNKIGESFLLNDGYSATVGQKAYNLIPNVPYNKSEFANRIIFSNVQVEDAFTNGYRVFQGLSYHDYDKQYGAIVKLVPWDNNLLVVMEHGVGVVGVNEQALMQTSTADTIHIYGHGVLSDHMQIISPDFGSKYEHSVIRTPLGVYGIDTDARKIWRFSTQKGFETLSDMKIESYLNDNMFTNEKVEMEICDVRTHYNETKGDIMFTFFKKRVAKKTTNNKIKAVSVINTAPINANPGETIERYFETTSDTTITSTGPATVVQTDTGFSITAPSDTYGSGVVVIDDGKGNKSEIDYTIKSPAEIDQEEQTEIEKGVKESLDDLTIKVSESGSLTIKTGDTKRFKVTLNKTSIGLSDLTVEYDPKIISYSISGDYIIVTGKNVGTTNFRVSYKDKHSADFRLNVIKKEMWVSYSTSSTTRELSDVDTVNTTVVDKYIHLGIGDYNGKVTVSVSDSSKIEYTLTSDRVILHLLAAGNPVVTIKDNNRTVKVTVPIVDDIPLRDVTWVTEGTCTDPGFSGNVANITMHVGESIEFNYKHVPENFEKSNYNITCGITARSVGYISASHMAAGGEMGVKSCTGSYYHNPYVEIKAKKVGSGVVELKLWKNTGGYPIKTYKFNVTVVE